MISRDAKVHYSTGFLFLQTISMSCRLAEIRWSVCIKFLQKFSYQRKMVDLQGVFFHPLTSERPREFFAFNYLGQFLVREFTIRQYGHISTFLHYSLWITFSTELCLVFNYFGLDFILPIFTRITVSPLLPYNPFDWSCRINRLHQCKVATCWSLMAAHNFWLGNRSAQVTCHSPLWSLMGLASGWRVVI